MRGKRKIFFVILRLPKYTNIGKKTREVGRTYEEVRTWNGAIKRERKSDAVIRWRP